jgi:hypothetical protein
MGMALNEHLNTFDDLGGAYSGARRAPRYSIQCRIRVVLPSHKGSKAFNGRGEDISAFGMAMFVGAELDVGDVVQIDFILPYQPQKLLVKATVRNRRGFRYGVEFTNTSDHERQAIAAACRALSLLQ